MSRRILILGAGVCGLAAAYRLLENDPTLHVTLLEQEERPGGLARSLTLNGQVADLGPHRLFTELPDVQDFLEDLAGKELEEVTRSSRMWLRGGWIEYPPKPLEIMQHLGIGKLAGAGASYALHKAGALLGGGGNERESFESLMTDAFGPELYNMLVAPYARKVWKVEPSQIHADIARVRVSAGGLDQMVKRLFIPEKEGQITAVKKFYYIPGGVEELVKKLRAGVEQRGGRIELVREVTAIKEFRTGHLQVTAVNRESGKSETHQAENVISTIPISDLLAMLLTQKPDEAVAKARSELRSIANFLVCLVAKRPRVTDAQWLYFPEKDTVFNRGYEPKNFHPSMGTKDQSLIVLEITCHEGDETWNRTDEQLIRATIRGIERVGLLSAKEIAATLVHRIPNTYPLYDLDYRRRLGRVWKYLEQFPQLISSGRQGLFLHNNMDHSIHMGFRAAARLLEGHESPAREFYTEVRRFQKFRIVD
jgi:protoporphyrinogen oxidase